LAAAAAAATATDAGDLPVSASVPAVVIDDEKEPITSAAVSPSSVTAAAAETDDSNDSDDSSDSDGSSEIAAIEGNAEDQQASVVAATRTTAATAAAKGALRAVTAAAVTEHEQQQQQFVASVKNAHAAKAKPVFHSDEDVFEVEELLRKRIVRGQTQYFVRWKGFDATYNTWEPEANVLFDLNKISTAVPQVPSKRKQKYFGTLKS
jgi:hypothetical protein